MCFSPTASFSLAGALAVSGGYCLHKAWREERALVPLAIIPIAFALQQFCEGWVWTGIHRGNAEMIKVAAISYLLFALLFWPVWIPFSTLLVVRSRRTRRALRAMTALGAILGLALMLPILVDPHWLAIQVHVRSVHYNLGDSPIFGILPEWLWEALYVIVVATPLFVSSVRILVHCGVAVIVSAMATYVFFDHALASVWCFFSAALSLYLVLVISSRPSVIRPLAPVVP
jgi:hypothetical protein